MRNATQRTAPCYRPESAPEFSISPPHHRPEFEEWTWAAVEGAIEFKRELYPAVFAAFRDWC